MTQVTAHQHPHSAVRLYPWAARNRSALSRNMSQSSYCKLIMRAQRGPESIPTNAGITVFDPPKREPENHTQGNEEDEWEKTEPAAESERIQPSQHCGHRSGTPRGNVLSPTGPVAVSASIDSQAA